MRRSKLESYLRTEGIQGTAKLLNSWIVGKSGGEIESIELIKYELEISVPGKPPYQIIHRQSTPFAVFSRFSEGMEIPVKVHPEKPKQILLDWEQPRTQVIEMKAADLPENVLEAIKGLGEVNQKKDLKDRLRELEDALEAGLITTQEYESKREELLKNL